MTKGFKDQRGKFHPTEKKHDFKISETFMFLEGQSDFESHHVDTVEAKDFDEAKAKAIKLFKIKESDVSPVSADLGEDTEGFEFELIRHDGRTGEKITEKEAEKLEEKFGEEITSNVSHGFEIEKVN